MAKIPSFYRFRIGSSQWQSGIFNSSLRSWPGIQILSFLGFWFVWSKLKQLMTNACKLVITVVIKRLIITKTWFVRFVDDSLMLMTWYLISKAKIIRNDDNWLHDNNSCSGYFTFLHGFYHLIIQHNSYWKWQLIVSFASENGGSFLSYVAVCQMVFQH